jgi:hypothetical protein
MQDHPPPDDRRRYPRVAIFAFVEMRSASETLILTVRNVSAGGALLSADGHDISVFPVGSRHSVALFTPGDDGRLLVLSGEVVRHQPDAMALRWDQDGTAFVALVDWLAEISR